MDDELTKWKRIAFYLAECHVATAAHLLELKSTSKHERERQVRICEHALRMLRDGEPYESARLQTTGEFTLTRLKLIVESAKEG